MADSPQDRNLPASQRKIDKARADGQVARSRDLGHLGAVGAGVALLAFFAPGFADATARLLHDGMRFDAALLAQDFHDLTGQVVAKVVKLASELEDSLVKLLVQVVPAEQREKVDRSALGGPVVDAEGAEGRTDVVSNQREVDDLLASLGF